MVFAARTMSHATHDGASVRRVHAAALVCRPGDATISDPMIAPAEGAMYPTNPGRVAGLLYCTAGLSGAFSVMYLSNTLIVPGNASATANNIRASEMLFRIGIVSELISSIALVFLVLALYRLLQGVNRTLATVMVILVLVAIPVALLNVANKVAVLTLVRGPDFLSVFDKPQLEALAMLFLRLHSAGLFVAQIFWGLWLIPFGLLVMRSGSIPRILGVLLIANGLAYPVVSLTWLLLPAHAGLVTRLALIPEMGELWIMLWLLIKGAEVHPVAEPIS
jgi:hypothetical protein